MEETALTSRQAQSALEEERARSLRLGACLQRAEASAAHHAQSVVQLTAAAELTSQAAVEASRFKDAAIDEVAASIATSRAAQGRADRAEAEAREARWRASSAEDALLEYAGEERSNPNPNPNPRPALFLTLTLAQTLTR